MIPDVNINPEILAGLIKEPPGFPTPDPLIGKRTSSKGVAISPTKKNREQSKKKRLMAKASRKANRRK